MWCKCCNLKAIKHALNSLIDFCWEWKLMMQNWFAQFYSQMRCTFLYMELWIIKTAAYGLLHVWLHCTKNYCTLITWLHGLNLLLNLSSDCFFLLKPLLLKVLSVLCYVCTVQWTRLIAGHSSFTRMTMFSDHYFHARWSNSLHWVPSQRKLLCTNFGENHVIFRSFAVAQPPRSTELNPYDS